MVKKKYQPMKRENKLNYASFSVCGFGVVLNQHLPLYFHPFAFYLKILVMVNQYKPLLYLLNFFHICSPWSFCDIRLTKLVNQLEMYFARVILCLGKIYKIITPEYIIIMTMIYCQIIYSLYRLPHFPL
jgi:hypothetical protein